ncbi:NTPase KAP [Sinorhizobium meliloti]|nr:NTPase KAP [Sinorhizobium meliloti]
MSEPEFNGDRPIQSRGDDLFGFAALADRIAGALTSQAGKKGFVFGLEGPWGSGKSSLLALTLLRLGAMDRTKVAAIEFRPWLIGDRDQLLTALFEDLAKAVAELQHALGDASGTTKQAASDVVKQVRSYARHLGPVGKLASLAGMIVPGASVVGEVFDKLAAAAAEQSDGPTLVAQKETLAKALLDLNCRIVVAIDDVDRLEPKEVAELLRLVRSVADFPNVSYLLCYDGPTLARAIETGTGVSSGTAYLEKIVQTEVAVPRPESFALRRWFTKELDTFVVCDEARLPVLQQVIDETGGRVLNNPRAVIRVLDSLRVFWPSLAGSVDVPDLVWLRLIAIGAPNFYRWVEDYLVTFAAMTSGRIHLSDEDRLAAVRDMDAAMASDGLSWERDQYELERHLPGINLFTFGMDGDRRLYSHEDRAALARAAADKRLASSSHARLYFALVAPADGISDLDFVRFRAAVDEGRAAVVASLTELHTHKGDAGASKAERLLDQLRYRPHETLRTWPLEPLVAGMADAADALAENKVFSGPDRPYIWHPIKSLLKQLKAAFPQAPYDGALASAFQTGTSPGFLTNLFREEIFGHGYFGGRPDPHDRLMSVEGFDTIRLIMLDRYAALGLDGVVAHPYATSMLYAWSQAGGHIDLMQQVAARALNSAWLLRFIQRLYGPQSTLSFDGMATFFTSPVAVIRRVRELAGAGDPTAADIIRSMLANSQASDDDFDAVLAGWEARENAGHAAGTDRTVDEGEIGYKS